MTALVSGANGRVYLDTTTPRVCIRGAEDLTQADFGYKWLAPNEVFPFFELRTAAVDLRGNKKGFDARECRRRIDAQVTHLFFVLKPPTHAHIHPNKILQEKARK